MKCTIYWYYYSQNDTPLLSFSVYKFPCTSHDSYVVTAPNDMWCTCVLNLPKPYFTSYPYQTLLCHQFLEVQFTSYPYLHWIILWPMLSAKLTIYANFQYTSIKVDGIPDSQPQCGLLYAVHVSTYWKWVGRNVLMACIRVHMGWEICLWTILTDPHWDWGEMC